MKRVITPIQQLTRLVGSLKASLVIASLFLVFSVTAQNGTIRGTIVDAGTGEPLIGVSISVDNTEFGAVTDFDGNFDISLKEGTYQLSLTYISFNTLVIEDVNVRKGNVTLLDNLVMEESSESLQEVVITAAAARNSEAGVLLLKRKSVNLIDGISSVSFRKIGDSDAGEAVKRVTGVSIEGGKYVYVRGLGDRYTAVTLNNIDIPGLDPDRNSLQLDIFPTNIIDNMIVLKSAVADLRADFTGGVVNIETKEFPESKVIDFTFGMSYNPSMHFNPNFLTYEGSNLDNLGLGYSDRALPEEATATTIPSPISGNSPQEVNTFLNKFDKTLGAAKQSSLMDYNLGFSIANQVALKNDNKLGYIFSLSYRKNQRFYDAVSYGEYQRLIDPAIYELPYATKQEGQIGETDVLVSALGGIAYKTKQSKYKLTIMHLQNGESRAGQFRIDNDGQRVGQSGYIATSDNLEYNQRGLTNVLLNGQHTNSAGDWKLDWRISPTFSNLLDPDIRKTAFTNQNDRLNFVAGAGGNPSRIWRSLDEINISNRFDVTKSYDLWGEKAKFKFGASYVYKERNYEILSFDIQFFGAQPDINGNPNLVMDQTSLYPNGSVYIVSGNNNPNPNAYFSTVSNTGFYVSNEFSPLESLKAIIGLRAENYVQRHTGRDVEFANFGTGNNLDNDKVLDALDFFPSVNLIYSLGENQNLRLSYARTIARPSFKELSFAQILDPITNRIFNGGLFQYSDWDGNLSETRIENMDIRWELYADQNQNFSLGAFYKFFNDPIELVRIPEQQTSTEYQPRNVGDGQLYGFEMEFSKNFAFVNPSWSGLRLFGNFTYVVSEIEMTDLEFNSRKGYEKVGETITNTRQMAGQAPYIINIGLGYDDPETGFDAGVFYNVKGKTLILVGAGLFPDVYAVPFHSLNFNMNKRIGKEKRVTINFGVSNILNDWMEEVYVGFRAQDQIFTRFNPNVSFSLGARYSLF